MSETTVLQRPARAMTLAIAQKKDAHYVDGRRAFFKYRELGVTEATQGRMRAQVTSTMAPMDRATGWHYHTCEMQFVYVIGGWLDLEFARGETIRFAAGNSFMIPGGVAHQELRTSDDFEILKVSVPAEMGTVNCDPPA